MWKYNLQKFNRSMTIRLKKKILGGETSKKSPHMTKGEGGKATIYFPEEVGGGGPDTFKYA